MNKYQELKDQQQKEFNAFPLGVAFSKEQFANMMAKWNLTVNDTDKICSLGAGCYIRKFDIEAYKNIGSRFKQEIDDAIAADPTGDGFIYDMFLYELANHEYCITYDLEDTLDALHLTAEQVNENKRLRHGLSEAIKNYLKNYENL